MAAGGAVPIPRELPLWQAALLGCGVVTGIGAVRNAADVQPGDAAAVVGCGGVGLNVVQGAKLAGAKTIIACDLLDNKLDFAREFGATHAVNAKKEDTVKRVKELTGGLGTDYAFDAIGGAQTALLFLGFGALFNFGAYWFSDKIALKMSGAKPLSEQDAPRLYQMVRELTTRAGLPSAVARYSSIFGRMSSNWLEVPVMLLPGWRRLETTPWPTGSATTAITIGVVDVASFMASVDCVQVVITVSSLSASSSRAWPGRIEKLPPAVRRSMTRFRPST